MSDTQRDDRAPGLPAGLVDDVAALAAVMAQHGMAKIALQVNGVHLTLTAQHAAPEGTVLVAAQTMASAAPEVVAMPATAGYELPAPMIGTYYSAPSPTSEPYVRVGDHVTAGQTICIIEAMKINNEIQAERGGIVEELYVSNGQGVEYNQPLMRLG